MSTYSRKVLPALLPKPTSSTSSSALSNKWKHPLQDSQPLTKKQKISASNSKNVLAVTSDPNTYKIPEHLLSTDQPKPRILKSCTRCRKHKTKCNYGQTAPNPCQSCSKKDLICQFEIVIPTKRSNMIKSLNESVVDLKHMVDALVSQEKILKNLCDSKGITVEGLTDVEKMDFSKDYYESFEEYDDEDYEDYEDDEEDDDEEEFATTLVKNDGTTTPLTSPTSHTSESSYTHSFKEAVIINNDNTPPVTSFDGDVPIKEELSLNIGSPNARPIKVT